MSNDLISREALKNALNYMYDCAYIDSRSKEGIVSDIVDSIDNAPTVDAIPNAEGYEMYNKGYVQGYERGKVEARPQATNNAELFKQTFGIYATEVWSMSESQFLEWLNSKEKR